MSNEPELVHTNNSSRQTTNEPATPSNAASPDMSAKGEIEALSNDKRFERLKMLVQKSKVYSSILTSRLANPNDEEPPAKRQKRGKGGRPKKNRTNMTLTEEQAKDLTNVNGEESQGVNNTTVSSFKQPRLVSGVRMYDYQLAGVEWLVSLYENGLNGILADEMGLGKTVQTIGFFAHLIENGIKGPFLIVAPLSTVANWMRELQTFSPKIKAVKYHGEAQERKRLAKEVKECNVVVTSYEMVMKDGSILRRATSTYQYIMVDEGHRLKNMNSKLIKELKRFDSANRLLLTGTPLQNNLTELWSLLNFLLPDIFADLEMFQEWFDEMAEDSTSLDHDKQLVTSLHEILRPFLLRRLKADVDQQLPEKREFVIHTKLTSEQLELYQAILEKRAKQYVINKILHERGETRQFDFSKPEERELPKTRKRYSVNYREAADDEEFGEFDHDALVEQEKSGKLLDQTDKLVLAASRETMGKSFQNMMMQLRLCCDTPHLFYSPWGEEENIDDRIVNVSSKMRLLERLSNKLTRKGHKFLVFSQFTKVLDIVEDYFTLQRGWPVCRIDGSTSQQERQEQIDEFNKNKKTKVFLLSTRSGGLGINLTAADTVVLFDSDWNPQMDLQAIDRVHRIGQTKPVLVIRLSTTGTVEKRMLKRASDKRQLEQVVIAKGKFKGLFGEDVKGESEVIDLLGHDLKRSAQQNVEEAVPDEIDDGDLDYLLNRAKECPTKLPPGVEHTQCTQCNVKFH